MYEVEVKVRAAHGPARERLAELGAEALGTVVQHDTYYDHPDRSFAGTDEALRLRREWPTDGGRGTPEARGELSDGAATAWLAYKGPRVDDVSKTRREVETGVADPDAVDAVLRAVGFESAAVVEKERERFASGDYTVVLDRVAGLGEFVEVEAEAAADEVGARRDGAFDLLEALGLDPAEATRQSYLALLLASGGGGASGTAG